MNQHQTLVKNELMKAFRIEQDINNKMEQIVSLRELATKASNVLSDMPGSPNRNIHKMKDAIVKMVDLENEIYADIHRLVEIKTDITRLIKRLGNRDQQLILEQRYLCFRPWEQIAVDLDFSIQHTFRIHCLIIPQK